MLNGLSKREAEDRIAELSIRFDMRQFLQRRCSDYSAGMRQKICISRSLLHNPPVLLLDEATSNLDIEASQELAEFVQESSARGAVVLYTTHRITELEGLCNKLLLLIAGRLVFSGTLDEFRKTANGSVDEAYRRMLKENSS
jgi:sodium transport system ATP-binding protein